MTVFEFVINWLKANLNGIIVGMVSTMLIGVRYNIMSIWNKIQSSKSAYTGWWEQIIYEINDADCKGSPVKHDYYYMNHVKNKYNSKLVINLEGRIRRKEPTEGRAWNVCGYLADDILTLLYRAYEGQKSRGCIYVKMLINDDFKGFYLEEHSDGTIDKTPLILRKVKDKRKIRELKKWDKKNKWSDRIYRKLF